MGETPLQRTRRQQRWAAYVFGVVFVAAILVLVFLVQNPSQFQRDVLRIVLSLAAGGVAAMIPGFLEVHFPNNIRAGGALAVFLVVYFFDPPSRISPPGNGGPPPTPPPTATPLPTPFAHPTPVPSPPAPQPPTAVLPPTPSPRAMPDNVVRVGPGVEGVLLAVRVSIGSTVHRGDIVAQIDRPDIVAESEAAEASLTAERNSEAFLPAKLAAERKVLEAEVSAAAARKARREAEVANLANLAGKDGLASQHALQEANSTLAIATTDHTLASERLANHDTQAKGELLAAGERVEAARKRLDIARARQNMLSVRSPTDGVVLAHMRPGETVSLGAVTPIVVIQTR